MGRFRPPIAASFAKRIAGRAAQRGGASFERMIDYRARLAGILPVRGGLVVKYVGDRPIPQKSGLDFALIYQGRTVFADAKSFAGTRFGKSQLTAHQVALAHAIAAHGGKAGFIVTLRAADAVLFIDSTLLQSRTRTGFCATDALPLGDCLSFDLRRIFAT